MYLNSFQAARILNRCVPLFVWLCAIGALAFGQLVAEEFLDGLTLDEPLPTRFTTGETYWVRGSVAEGIPGLTFEFFSEERTLEHRAVVVDGRVDHPLVFKHSDVGEYTVHIVIFPFEEPMFFSEFTEIEVVEGEGPIERPWEYYDSLIHNAYFRPNVILTGARELPPLFVSTGGRAENVSVFVPDGGGGFSERVLLDDGRAGDERAGDGIFTMTGETYHPPGYELGSFGSVTVDIFSPGTDLPRTPGRMVRLRPGQ